MADRGEWIRRHTERLANLGVGPRLQVQEVTDPVEIEELERLIAESERAKG